MNHNEVQLILSPSPALGCRAPSLSSLAPCSWPLTPHPPPHRPHPHPRGRCWSRGPCGEAGGGGGSRGLGGRGGGRRRLREWRLEEDGEAEACGDRVAVGRGGGRRRRDWRLVEDDMVLDYSSARWSPTMHLQLPHPLVIIPSPYYWCYQPPMDDALIVFDQMGIKVYIVFFYPLSILITHLYQLCFAYLLSL